MSRTTIMAAAVAATLMPFGGAATAQTVSAADPEGLAQTLRDMGYRATVTTDNLGDPKIDSSTQGVDFEIYFYGCITGAACKDLEFAAGFDLPQAISTNSVNSWNRQKLYGRAYTDEEGDPFLRFFVPSVVAMDRASFERLISQWNTGLDEFLDFIDW